MKPDREREIRARLAIVISSIDADMAMDLLEELDSTRDKLTESRYYNNELWECGQHILNWMKQFGYHKKFPEFAKILSEKPK